MKKIKVIELLNMIAEGKEVPKKIKDGSQELILHSDGEHYFGNTSTVLNSIGMFRLNDYVEIIDPILDEEEKKYLSAVIKPFRKNIEYIQKIGAVGCQYIRIKICNEYICFPNFKKDSMYEGMEVEKKYTLEELGL